jgi:hypothetical protein
LVLVIAGALPASACGSTGIQVATTPIPTIAGTTGSFDDIAIDQETHRLFVADRSDQGVDVFDISAQAARYLQTIPMPASPNGLAVASDLQRLFVGTSSGSVVVADIRTQSPTTNDVIAEVHTGGKEADLLDYGAARHRIYASNGADGTITSIDSETHEILAHFNVGHTLEQPRYYPADGMVYVTSPDADALFRIDPNDGTVKSNALGGCAPMGMAINPKAHQALIACKDFVMSWDLSSGKSEVFGQIAAGDVVSYYPGADRFLVASPHGVGHSVIGIFGGTPIAYLSTVVTDAQGKSAAFDETTHVVYTPDGRANRGGIASFQAPAVPPRWLSLLTEVAPWAALLVALGLLIYVVARSADPVRRRPSARQPAP